MRLKNNNHFSVESFCLFTCTAFVILCDHFYFILHLVIIKRKQPVSLIVLHVYLLLFPELTGCTNAH